MILTGFLYKEDGWELEKLLPLQPLNLIVGKNASGKSKTIKALGDAISILLQQKWPSSPLSYDIDLQFTNNKKHIEYHFAIKSGAVVNEILLIDNEEVLKRDENSAVLCGETINPPTNKLIPHVRRDTVRYPNIEQIMLWAEQACGMSFNEMDIAGDNSTSSFILGNLSSLYNMVDALTETSMDRVISLAKKMDYPMKQIGCLSVNEIKKIIFMEQGVGPLLGSMLSKGMFRTLYLLICMEYLSQKAIPSLLMIDDLCEGLDYDRSTLLGKFVFDFCKEHNIQLIASSNDTFLMDVVDIEFWNILNRKGGKVDSINIVNNKNLFDDFAFTGLSNFDFLSSDYIQRHLQQSKKNE